ncbi:MAG TPA: AraC family transcriptional regulator [Candidatus Limnocylindrales bacterium]|nr:AraC family transcriptional regulator [Candidatus Limnocylindrales bacterium]
MPAAVQAWTPAIPGIREVLHARFAEHTYPPHTHDTWTLFLVDDGRVRYDLEGRANVAVADRPMVSILPPHVVHDGRPGGPAGYRKRVIYVETSVLPEALIGAAVDRPSIVDARLRRAVSDLHDTLACVDDRLDAETRFVAIASRLRTHLGATPEPRPAVPDRTLADALRAFLDDRAFEPVTLAKAAEELRWSEAHLARAFTAVFGISPHAYLIGRRLDAARSRILAGEALADVAAAVGFYDQAHLPRRFKRFLATTPRAFGRSGHSPSAAVV